MHSQKSQKNITEIKGKRSWPGRIAKLWLRVNKYYLSSSPLFEVTISDNSSFIESRMFGLHIFPELLSLSYQISFCHDPMLK